LPWGGCVAIPQTPNFFFFFKNKIKKVSILIFKI
jgi:hypothetical protein